MAGESKANTTSGVNEAILRMLRPPIWDELSTCKNILLAGCGGGYDFIAGLPLLFALESCGVTVHLANLTFTTTEDLNCEKITPVCFKATADSTRKGKGWKPEAEPYWPEMLVSRWFRSARGQERPVYMFNRCGVVHLQAAYEALFNSLNLDCIILVDGGTDSLMFGNEEGLGTPQEDMLSIAAVSGLAASLRKTSASAASTSSKAVKSSASASASASSSSSSASASTASSSTAPLKTFLMCLGFGIDCGHGVNHHDFLRNVATIQRMTPSGYLGSFALHGQLHKEAELAKACFEACDPGNSIVNSCAFAACEGKFGNSHPPAIADRVRGSVLYLSPLMAQYWAFRLDAVASQVLYMDNSFRSTTSYTQVCMLIQAFRTTLKDTLPTQRIPY